MSDWKQTPSGAAYIRRQALASGEATPTPDEIEERIQGDHIECTVRRLLAFVGCIASVLTDEQRKALWTAMNGKTELWP